jgi:hypothetical protein
MALTGRRVLSLEGKLAKPMKCNGTGPVSRQLREKAGGVTPAGFFSQMCFSPRTMARTLVRASRGSDGMPAGALFPTKRGGSPALAVFKEAMTNLRSPPARQNCREISDSAPDSTDGQSERG